MVHLLIGSIILVGAFNKVRYYFNTGRSIQVTNSNFHIVDIVDCFLKLQNVPTETLT